MSTNGHRYTVELRVYGATLDPDVVTQETGLQPCGTHIAGSQFDSKIWSESMWGFDGGGPRDWESLEEGLVFVLDRVAAAQPLFARYSREYEVIWWCGHFQRAFDGGPVLSARLLERLAAFGVPLFIDNYFSRRESSDPP